MNDRLLELISEFDQQQGDVAKRCVLEKTVRCLIQPFVPCLPCLERQRDDRLIKTADKLIHAIVHELAPPEALMSCLKKYAHGIADEVHALEIVAYLALVANSHTTDWHMDRHVDIIKRFVRDVTAKDDRIALRSTWLVQWAEQDKTSRERTRADFSYMASPHRNEVSPLVTDLCEILDSLEPGERELAKAMIKQSDKKKGFRDASYALGVSERKTKEIFRDIVQPKVRRLMELIGAFPSGDQQEDTSQEYTSHDNT